MAEVAEASFKRMISTFIRQTRPQSFRSGKPPRYPQRYTATAATAATAQPAAEDEKSVPEWQQHSISRSGAVDTGSNKPRLDKLRSDLKTPPFSSFLTDNYAREHNYLRISVTERCNLRCLYCMPEEGVPLSPPAHNLTTSEIVYLSSLFVSQGVDKIRLTGGEPTVRKDIVDLMQQIGNLRKDGLKELCLTTNGISLHRKLDSMVEAGLTGVNLSLDTLDPFQFTIMTRRNGHDAVMKSINRILEMNRVGAGIKLKINCVVMRGMNEREIVPFVEMGREKDLEVRFIEYMPFDGNKWSKNKMLSFEEMLALIREKYPDVQKVQGHLNDTSKTYQIPGFAGRIGFITSMTHNFCGTCNRLRITSDGNLKVCLFGNSEVSLRDILREYNDGKPIDTQAMEAIKQLEMDRRQRLPDSSGELGFSPKEAQLLEVIGMAVKRKKEKHAGMGKLENMKNRPMILIDDFIGISHPFIYSSTHLPVPSHATYSRVRGQRSPHAIPLHLLASGSSPMLPLQRRYSSTPTQSRSYTSIRRIPGRSVFRRMPLNTPWNPRNTQSSQLSKENKSQSQSDVHNNGNMDSRPRIQSGGSSSTSGSPTISESSISQDSYEDFNSMEETNVSSNPSTLNEASPDNEIPATISKVPSSSSGTSSQLSHLTSSGAAHMVNITAKRETARSATAVAMIMFSRQQTFDALQSATQRKGDAIAVARIAGIQAAKKTADLIPLAHPGLGLTGVVVDMESFPARQNITSQDLERLNGMDGGAFRAESLPHNGGVFIQATVDCHGKTGVEMEALTAATVTALTLFDMLKGVDKFMAIGHARVIAKIGGKSGDWTRNKVSQSDTTAEHEHDIGLDAGKKGTKINHNVSINEEQGRPGNFSSMPKSTSSRHDAGGVPGGSRDETTRNLEHEKLKWREERLRNNKELLEQERQKLKTQQAVLQVEQQKVALASINIEREIQEGIQKRTRSVSGQHEKVANDFCDRVDESNFAMKRIEHFNQWASTH